MSRSAFRSSSLSGKLKLLIIVAGILAASVRMDDQSPARTAVGDVHIARYSHPSSVLIYVIYVSQLLLGILAVNSLFEMFSATRRLCLETVVTLNLRFWMAWIPASRISRSALFLPQWIPTLPRCLWMRGLPYVLRLLLLVPPGRLPPPFSSGGFPLSDRCRHLLPYAGEGLLAV
ncbi:hypothetical protein MHFGQ_03270 [Moorella humiferrea]